MKIDSWKSLSRVLALVTVVLIPGVLAAQSAPAKKGTSTVGQPYASRWDIFAGYSYLAPRGTVQVPQTGGGTLPFSYKAVNVGGLFSGAYYFNRWLGAQVEFGEHQYGGNSNSQVNPTGTKGNNDGFYTIGGGLIGRFPTGNITPFIHGLVNLDQVGGPDHNVPTWGPGLTAGGGLDYELPWLNHRLALRLFQADYEYMHADFGTQTVPVPGPPGGRANINAARLSAGIVIHAGSIEPPPPVTLGCSVNPQSVFPGGSVTITATAGSVDPKDNVLYSWTGNGANGTANSVTINTSNMAPGSYSASATVKAGKKGKEGLKPWETATCSASYTVKEFEPPTISCSANPTTVQPGGTSTITCVGVSPQNRPLTYSYSASAGSVSGSGTTATFSSAGAPTGAVGITGQVADDKGHSASASTTVTVLAPPPPPPQPHAQALCSISFATDTKRPTRVDNEAKACLDQVALTLKQQADAKAVVVADSNAKEKDTEAKEQARAAKNKHVKIDNFAAQRAVNAKDYLVTDQGIDASRITPTTGTGDDQSAQDYLVPAGANFSQDVQGTTPVDESTVKPETRKPLPMRHPAKKSSK
jgi:hypothetical protein